MTEFLDFIVIVFRITLFFAGLGLILMGARGR